MNIFSHQTIVRLGIMLVGVGIGAEWSEVFTPYVTTLIVVGALISVAFEMNWFSKK